MSNKTRLDIVRQSDWDTSSAKAEITTKHDELDAQDTAILASINDVVVDVAQNEADAADADAALGVRIDGVEANLASEIAATNGDVSDLQDADAAIQTALDAQEDKQELERAAMDAAYKAADADIQTALDAQEAKQELERANMDAAYKAADTVLTNNLAVETARVDAILLASDADKNSFAEIVGIINDVDTVNDDALAVVIGNLNAEIATTNGEVSDLQDADTAIQTALDVQEAKQELERANMDAAYKAADTAIQTALDAQEAKQELERANMDAAYKAADAINATAISDEANTRAAADVQAATDNADARTALQTTLEGQIETLRTESEDADDAAEVALNDAVATLTSNLDAEIATTGGEIDAINTNIAGLTSSLAAEVVAREEADEELDNKISDIISNTDISAMDGFNEVEDHLERLEDYHMSHLVLGSTPAAQVMDKNATVPNSINFQPMGGGSYEHKVKVGTLQIVMNGQMLHQGVDFDTTGTDELVDMVNFNFDVESDDVFDFWAVIKPDAIEYTGGGY